MSDIQQFEQHNGSWSPSDLYLYSNCNRNPERVCYYYRYRLYYGCADWRFYKVDSTSFKSQMHNRSNTKEFVIYIISKDSRLCCVWNDWFKRCGNCNENICIHTMNNIGEIKYFNAISEAIKVYNLPHSAYQHIKSAISNGSKFLDLSWFYT